MARRKAEERHIRKIFKTGGGASYGVTLPIEIMVQLGWREGQKVVVRQRGKKIIISDWREKRAT